MGRRASAEEMRIHVSWALLNIGRPDLLEDSPLVGILGIRADGALWGRGRALGKQLADAVHHVSEGLADIPKMARHKSLLDDVVQHGKSLSQWAREQGRSREGVSRGAWRDLTEWVTEELQRLTVLAATAHGNR